MLTCVEVLTITYYPHSMGLPLPQCPDTGEVADPYCEANIG